MTRCCSAGGAGAEVGWAARQIDNKVSAQQAGGVLLSRSSGVVGFVFGLAAAGKPDGVS